MDNKSFSVTMSLPNSPAEVYDAVTNPRAWWSEGIQGSAAQVGDEFDYSYKDIHSCRVKITEAVPGEKVTWKVLDNYFNFVSDQNEWIGDEITFEIAPEVAGARLTFTHHGLVEEYECYEVCSGPSGWGQYIPISLRALIVDGAGLPNPAGTARSAWDASKSA